MLVLRINKPSAGAVMAFRCTVLSLGIRKPLSPEKTSNTADGSGVVVLIPTLWAIIDVQGIVAVRTATLMANKNFFIDNWLEAVCFNLKVTKTTISKISQKSFGGTGLH